MPGDRTQVSADHEMRLVEEHMPGTFFPIGEDRPERVFF